jgi:hypothetical protein
LQAFDGRAGADPLNVAARGRGAGKQGVFEQALNIVARFFLSVAAVTGAVALTWSCAAPSAQLRRADPADAILIRYAAPDARMTIQDSKWGAIGRLQEAIDRHARACGVAPIVQDGRYDRATAEAARAIASCRGARIDVPGDHLTVEAWQAVTGEPAPGAYERALALVHTMEGSDYDRLEWNVCVKFTGDQGSVLTWGPNGKTLGWGGELMAVLDKLDRSTVYTVFAAEGADGVDRLFDLKTAAQLHVRSKHRYPQARALMERLCQQPGQMRAWSRAFARLGAMPETQRVYESVAWGDSAWFRYVVERLERSWRAVGLEPTEVDFAFFLDRSIHMGWGAARFEAVDAALADARSCLSEKAFTNARARLIVADAVRAKAREEDRMGRDAMFLVDSESTLREAMRRSPTWPKAWKRMWSQRTGIAASDVGLSDARPAPRFGDGPAPI